jgi:cysteine desulfurase
VSRHYLDHASTSPPRPEAVDAMVAWLRDPAGDPSRIHAEGLRARVALEQARQQVADLLGARSREVVFTSGATEAIATAVWGAAARGGHLVVPAVEHSAVREAAGALAEAGTHEVTTVGVDGLGRVDPDELLAAVRHDTTLVALQLANHEVGTVQPVAAVAAACREQGVLVLVDAAMAAGHLPIDVRTLGVDLLAVSGHKLGGPPGTGALLIRRGLRLRPLLRGGEQERARRGGLENVPALVGLGAACAALTAADGTGPTRLEVEAVTARRLTRRVLDLADRLDGVHVYGDPDHRAPQLVCLGVEGIEPQAVLLGLDRAGIAAHSGSACSSEALEPSPVLEAMGVDAHRSLRLSVGWSTTETDLDALEAALPRVLHDLRALQADDAGQRARS